MRKKRVNSLLAPVALVFMVSLGTSVSVEAEQTSTGPCGFEKETLAQNTLPSYKAAIVDLYDAGCLGGEHDKWSVAKELRESRPTDKSVALLKVRFSILSDALKQEIENGIQVRQDALKPLWEPLRMVVLAQSTDKLEPLGAVYWHFDPSHGDFRGGLTLKIYDDILNPACTEIPSQTCSDAYEAAKRALQYAKVAELEVFQSKGKLKIAKLYLHVESLNAEWENYFQDARSQFPWELALNGYLYNKFDRKADGAILQAPPRYQWILLHPSVALEYIDQANEGNQFRESVILEIAGYNWWNWENRDRDTALGLSFITSYSDRSGTRDVGFGAMAHYNHTLSLGGTLRKGGDPGVFISVDVGRFLLKASESTKKAFQFGK